MNQKHNHYSSGKLKRGLYHFLFGKLGSAGLNIVIFVLAARVLSVADYGAYVAVLAFYELVGILSGFGVEWVGIRYIPEFRQHASSRQMMGFLARLALTRLFLAAIGGFIIWIFAGKIANFFANPGWADMIGVFGIVMVIEQLGRFLRDVVLGSLLLQWQSQLCQILRNIALLSVFALMAAGHLTTSAHMAALGELMAAVSALLPALGFVWLACRRKNAADQDWVPPQLDQMIKLAWHNHLSTTICLAYSGYFFTLWVAKLAGPEATALFGFARNLTDQVRRYLPAELFIGVIRPVIIATYAKDHDFSLLNRQTNLVYKLGLFVLLPLAAFVWTANSALPVWIGGARYSSASAYICLMLLVLVPFSHRRVLELVTNTVQQTHLWSKSAVFSLLALPVALIFAQTRYAVPGMIATMLLAELLANAVLVRGLRRAGFSYSVDGIGIGKMVVLAVLVGGGLASMVNVKPDVVSLMFGAVATAFLFFALAYIAKPFQDIERKRINQMLPIKLFVW